MKKENKKAFSLMEMMIVVLLITGLIGGGYLVFSTGQATWFATAVNIELQSTLRQALQRISMELRQTEIGQPAQQVLDGAGHLNTDVLRFSVPVICVAGGSLVDANGDVAHWGAPLRWGCTDSTCMDADNDCGTVDYKYIEYRVDNDNQLLRRVLDGGFTLVDEIVVAQHISDFQVLINGNVFNIQIAAEDTTDNNRLLTAQTNMDIFVRN